MFIHTQVFHQYIYVFIVPVLLSNRDLYSFPCNVNVTRLSEFYFARKKIHDQAKYEQNNAYFKSDSVKMYFY